MASSVSGGSIPVEAPPAIEEGVSAQPHQTPPLTLYVSNQSFDEPTIGIRIELDGDAVVDDAFDVEGQHNWVRFDPEVTSGSHTLHAVSATGAESTTDFVIPDGASRWIVVEYWFHVHDGPPRLVVRIFDEPVAFD